MRITMEHGDRKYGAEFDDNATATAIGMVVAQAVTRARKIEAGQDPGQTLPVIGQYGDTYDENTFREVDE